MAAAAWAPCWPEPRRCRQELVRARARAPPPAGRARASRPLRAPSRGSRQASGLRSRWPALPPWAAPATVLGRAERAETAPRGSPPGSRRASQPLRACPTCRGASGARGRVRRPVGSPRRPRSTTAGRKACRPTWGWAEPPQPAGPESGWVGARSGTSPGRGAVARNRRRCAVALPPGAEVARTVAARWAGMYRAAGAARRPQPLCTGVRRGGHGARPITGPAGSPPPPPHPLWRTVRQIGPAILARGRPRAATFL